MALLVLCLLLGVGTLLAVIFLFRKILSKKDLEDAITKSSTKTDEAISKLLLKKDFDDALSNRQTEITHTVTTAIGALDKRMLDSGKVVQEAVEKKLDEIRKDNDTKLEKIRVTVDEKLHETLERRLGESFKRVSDQLESVNKGLGEMQSLASGVGDLKKVLSNVKTRGTWGEVQLGNLLEQFLVSEQYDTNVSTKKGSSDRVEFAIKLPGKGKDVVWLPIDAKFPLEDYQRLVDAQEKADVESIERESKALEQRIKLEAKNIHEKYVDPPHTTDFAILFLPNEGLYAEVLRRPGLADQIQREYKVILTGPTTIAAILNSLQMGFRTLAIEKRSGEVWNVLNAVKTEFGKFGDLLEKTQKKLQEASDTIESASTKSRTIVKKLNKVHEVSPGEETKLLPTVEE